MGKLVLFSLLCYRLGASLRHDISWWLWLFEDPFTNLDLQVNHPHTQAPASPLDVDPRHEYRNCTNKMSGEHLTANTHLTLIYVLFVTS